MKTRLLKVKGSFAADTKVQREGSCSGDWQEGLTVAHRHRPAPTSHPQIRKAYLRYNFEWDPAKARGNLNKHQVAFETAATVFLDPYAISIFDEEHGTEEERWVTLGIDRDGSLLVVCHTFLAVDETTCSIRIISARKATKTEARRYEEPV